MFTTGESDESVRAEEDEVRELLERARGGDPATLPALRAALDRRPGLWRAYGDLAAHARGAWIDLIGGPDMALKAALARTAESMLADLAGPAAPALERLLAERVVAGWLQVNHADALAAQAGGLSIRQASFAQARMESAQRRHIAAVAALATLRRLLPATVEIVVPESANTKPGEVTVDVTGEVEGVRPADRPTDPRAWARGGAAGTARLIPIESARSTADRRRRGVDRPRDEGEDGVGDACHVAP